MRIPPLSFYVTALALATRAMAADPLAELSSFSVFDKVDLARLASGEIKTAHGPPMSNSRYLSVQSCYVVPGSPAEHLQALRSWDPAKHREMKIYLHGDLPSSPSAVNFAKLKSVPDNSGTRAFVAATNKMSNDLQLSKAEAAKWKGGEGTLATTVGEFWMEVLAGRARTFANGGSAGLAPYDHSGNAIRASEEMNGLLREQGKLRKQFAGFLENTGIGRGAGSIRPDLYWELLDVDDAAVASLGAFYGKTGGEGLQAAETYYYASGGYYANITLYQLWPVDVNGRASTLVWRGDMISSSSLSSLHGVEKLASESAMMKEVGKTVTLFRKDVAR